MKPSTVKSFTGHERDRSQGSTTDSDIAGTSLVSLPRMRNSQGPRRCASLPEKDVELKVKPSAKRVESVRKDFGRMKLEPVWR